MHVRRKRWKWWWFGCQNPLPVLRRHLHMWISSCQYICKSSHSWIPNNSGSRHNYFSANVFIYVLPHCYPVCFCFFQWIDMNNMVATCIMKEKQRLETRTQPGKQPQWPKSGVLKLLESLIIDSKWNGFSLVQISSSCFRGQMFAHCRCPAHP